MGDRTHDARAEGIEQHAALPAAVNEGRGIRNPAAVHETKDDDVRLNGVKVDLDVIATQQLVGEQPSVAWSSASRSTWWARA